MTEMISIRIVGPDDRTIGDLKVADDLRVGDLIHKISVGFRLKGEVAEFDLFSLRDGGATTLPPDYTLARVGLQNHDTLKLVPLGPEELVRPDGPAGERRSEFPKIIAPLIEFARAVVTVSPLDLLERNDHVKLRQLVALEERVRTLADSIEQATHPQEQRHPTELRGGQVEIVLTEDAFRPRLLARVESIAFIEDCRREERIWSAVCTLLLGGVLGILSQVSLTDAFTSSSLALLALLAAGAGYSCLTSRRFRKKAEQRKAEVFSKVYYPYSRLVKPDERRDPEEVGKPE